MTAVFYLLGICIPCKNILENQSYQVSFKTCCARVYDMCIGAGLHACTQVCVFSGGQRATLSIISDLSPYLRQGLWFTAVYII